LIVSVPGGGLVLEPVNLKVFLDDWNNFADERVIQVFEIVSEEHPIQITQHRFDEEPAKFKVDHFYE
jgi:hypothetical protein